ncbi:MAG: Maf family protein [Clostridiales bacterium]|jgi:septum formation protein|nr:Maf family protein [Clostridiales bacterium]
MRERVVLASGSPRRAELLKEIFEEFEIIPPFDDEKTDEKSPEKAVMDLAEKKAEEVFRRLKKDAERSKKDEKEIAALTERKDAERIREAADGRFDNSVLIISCDTAVCFNGEFLGKPKDRADAFNTLKKLNGKAHTVYSGVCVIRRRFGGKNDLAENGFAERTAEKKRGIEPRILSGSGERRGADIGNFTELLKLKFYDLSGVFFKENSDAEIDEYIERFAPFDKAGAYGIQDGRLVEKYEGSYKNIVGLPVEKIKNELRKNGFMR